MSQIFEITMKSKDGDATISRIIYRIKGLNKEQALTIAQNAAGDNYFVYYVINGPRLDE